MVSADKKFLIRLLRGIELFRLIGIYVLVSWWLMLRNRDPDRRRRALIANTSVYCRRILQRLQVEVTVRGKENLPRDSRPYLLVANHLSYVDILVMAAIYPATFVTSIEVASSMFLGMIVRCGGSLFVERRSIRYLWKEIGDLTRTLGSGYSVVIFPEATSSDGVTMLPFKRALIAAAIICGVDVIPVCLKYTKVDGQRAIPEHKETVCYYGGATFFKHLYGLLGVQSIQAEVTILDVIPMEPHYDGREIAAMAQQRIGQVYWQAA